MKKMLLLLGSLSAWCVGSYASEHPRRSSDPSADIAALRERLGFSDVFLKQAEKKAKEYEDAGEEDSNNYFSAIDARKHVVSGSYWAEKELDELEFSCGQLSEDNGELAVASFGKAFLDTEQRKENAQHILEDYKKVNWPQMVSLWERLIAATK